jgi:hypothetical protein
MQNKRGQGLEVSTLILIVLGVIILVLLVLGFSMGWGNLWEKVNIFQGGSSIESVIQGCKVAVSSASTYSYCNDFKKITVNGKIEYVNCEDARVKGNVGGTLTCDNAAAVATQCLSLYNSVPMKDNKKDCSALASVDGSSCATLNADMINKCSTVINSCTDYPVGEAKAFICDSALKKSCAKDEDKITGVTFKVPLKPTETCCKVACADVQ